jgi:hypothetical protein
MQVGGRGAFVEQRRRAVERKQLEERYCRDMNLGRPMFGLRGRGCRRERGYRDDMEVNAHNRRHFFSWLRRFRKRLRAIAAAVEAAAAEEGKHSGERQQEHHGCPCAEEDLGFAANV